MKLLLDTHVLLWWLGIMSTFVTVADLIRNPENMVFVSAVSLWEIWLKRSLGKLRLPDAFELRLAAEPFDSPPSHSTDTPSGAPALAAPRSLRPHARGAGAQRETPPADSRRCRGRLWRLCPGCPAAVIRHDLSPDVLRMGVGGGPVIG